MHNLHFIDGEHVHQGYLFYNFLQSLITSKFELIIYIYYTKTQDCPWRVLLDKQSLLHEFTAIVDLDQCSSTSGLYLSFNPNSPMDQMKALEAMEPFTSNLHKWMYRDKLKINDGKTQFLVIRLRQQLLKIDHCSVHVGMMDIKPV